MSSGEMLILVCIGVAIAFVWLALIRAGVRGG
jgi:hypothetical protein